MKLVATLPLFPTITPSEKRSSQVLTTEKHWCHKGTLKTMPQHNNIVTTEQQAGEGGMELDVAGQEGGGEGTEEPTRAKYVCACCCCCNTHVLTCHF